METLLLNDSKKIDEIKLIFKNNEIEINLKNLIHIEDISLKTTGILISREFEPLYLRPCLLYTSPSPRDATLSRMPSSA